MLQGNGFIIYMDDISDSYLPISTQIG